MNRFCKNTSVIFFVWGLLNLPDAKANLQDAPLTSSPWTALVQQRERMVLGEILQAVPPQGSHDTTQCSYYHEYVGRVQFYRQSSGPNCWLTVHPDGKDLVYRSYLFDQNGFMMVFNSYGDGPIASHTGARVFYVFPRSGAFPWASVPDLGLGTLVVEVFMSPLLMSTSSGRWWLDSPIAFVKEDTQIHRRNRGGVELQLKDGVLLDSGFRLGGDPRVPQGRSVFRDRQGRTCEVANQHIFHFTGEDVELRWTQDRDVLAFLQKSCLHLETW